MPTNLPDTWRAALLRRPGDALQVVNIRRPDLGRGQLLVELIYSGVCRSQLMEVRGLRGPDRWLPHLLGHEGVGTVVAIGPDVTKVEVGDRVVIGWMRGRGIDCSGPALRATTGEPINAGKATTFSEYSVVSESRVYRRPPGLDDHIAVLLGCALLTGAGMVLKELSPEPGETVLINGLGGVGLSALLAATTLAVTVVAVDPDSEKRNLALSLGASHAIDPSAWDMVQQVHQLWPLGVDSAIDSSGTVLGIEAAFASLKSDGGHLVFASHPPSGERIRIDPHDLISGKRITGSWGGDSCPDDDIPKLVQAISGLDVKLDFMVPKVYPLSKINQALTDLEMSRTIRPLISMGSETQT